MKRIKKISIVAASILGTTGAILFGYNKLNNKSNKNEVELKLNNNTPDVANVDISKLEDKLYVSPNASSSGDGSESNPYKFEVAVNKVKPGTTLLLKEGTYKYDNRVQVGGNAEYEENINKYHGDSAHYVTIRPLDLSKRVIFDFSGQEFADNNRGIQVYGNFWHFYGIEVCNAGDNGLYIGGSHNIVENCIFYNNADTGLQLGRTTSSQGALDQWPSYNLIKNCTSFGNYDAPTFGENADGFAAKLTVGYGNVFDGCIAFRNSDDGWDLFAKVDSGDIGTVTLYNCASFENGFLPYKNYNTDDVVGYNTYDTLNGDGIGFKLGGSVMKGNVIVENCATWDNKLHGVSDNSNPGVISIKNLTAFNNCAGINQVNGEISATRGLENTQNKSNNIDLARSVDSYNNYYGVLSYVNNQKNFSTANESSYNRDAFKGSVGYSIFNPKYDHGEIYTCFGEFEDGSSYNSDTVDTTFSYGKVYEPGIKDTDFKSLTSFNAITDSVDNVKDLASYHKTLRNADFSVNLGDHLALNTSSDLNTYCEGNPIGAVLNKTSYKDYKHYSLNVFGEGKEYTDNQVKVLSAYSITEVICNPKAVFQDFRIPKLIHGADINWVSSNTDVISIDTNEELTTSKSVFSWARVSVPDETTTVKLTATISIGSVSMTKEFTLTVKGRNQLLGDLVSTNDDVLRVELYRDFAEPKIYALDGSSISSTPLPLSAYSISYKYEYALDGNSKFHVVDGIYTSVPGVFRVTATAINKDATKTSKYTYMVYVVDPDCPIDFINGSNSVVLSQDGFVVNGDLSNISGNVIATYSMTEKNYNTASDILALGEGSEENKYQTIDILTNKISAPFIADNRTEVEGNIQYYIYYAVVNTNKSNNNAVFSATINVQNVVTMDDFYFLARTGILPGGASNNTTIYSLNGDLDFSTYEWNVEATTTSAKQKEINGTTMTIKPEGFKGLFRGNGHTISGITAVGSSTITAESQTIKVGNKVYCKGTDKYVNVFYKLNNGTIMDTYFNNIILDGDTASKQIGIIGDMVGGYVYNVHVSNTTASGKESSGGVVAKVSGGSNSITECSFVNPIPMNGDEYYETFADLESRLTYKVATTNKYGGGIVGNAQLNSDQTYLQLTLKNNYVNAVIGDGHDAGGNMGLLLGRCKGEYTSYELDIENNVVYGIVIGNGQYLGGIVGDFDNGSLQVTIKYNLSDVIFFYKEQYLNAYAAAMNNADQTYAHKNCNPIVGRAVKADAGLYTTGSNIGSWTEYYKTYVGSASIAFDYSEYSSEHEFWHITQFTVDRTLKLDSSIWYFDNTNYTLVLQALLS